MTIPLIGPFWSTTLFALLVTITARILMRLLGGNNMAVVFWMWMNSIATAAWGVAYGDGAGQKLVLAMMGGFYGFGFLYITYPLQTIWLYYWQRQARLILLFCLAIIGVGTLGSLVVVVLGYAPIAQTSLVIIIVVMPITLWCIKKLDAISKQDTARP